MHIRSYSWGEANISWSVVIEELLFAAENMGHDVVFLSTNGYKGMKYWTGQKGLRQDIIQRQYLRDKKIFDIDLTYTVPQNFPQRFINDSKKKLAIYAYESSIMPAKWKGFYHLVDYMLPPSQYVADMMLRNGCPKEKIVIVPHGVDTDVFNPDVAPLKLQSDKKVKFLCVAEPHYRKQLDKLLRLFCETFTADDDVSFVLKTKLFKPGDEIKGFEMDLKPVLLELKKQYGAKMPEIKVISKRLDNIASLYTACDAFVLMTASEGWGVPYLEALACGIPVIAPKHGGQLQFLNDSNAILTPCGTRKARGQEQYWQPHPDAMVGNPNEKVFGEAMKRLYRTLNGDVKLYKKDIESKIQCGLETARELTWKNAMQQIIDLSNA
jgi:glycosyltransferase involved in cell wall biosynthesis